jgi:hypothetical protein
LRQKLRQLGQKMAGHQGPGVYYGQGPRRHDLTSNLSGVKQQTRKA